MCAFVCVCRGGGCVPSPSPSNLYKIRSGHTACKGCKGCLVGLHLILHAGLSPQHAKPQDPEALNTSLQSHVLQNSDI